MTLICNLEGVRGGDSGYPVQLVRDDDSGRLNIRGINEGGFACIDIDLADLVEWFSSPAADKLRKHFVGYECFDKS